MTMMRVLAAAPLAALALAMTLGLAGAQEGPDRGAGSSGRSDGSGMGQDNSEIGTPKGPGDKPAPAAGDPAPKERRLEGTSPEGPGLIGRCDDGRPPTDGACPR